MPKLSEIEGIGSKYAKVLADAGIRGTGGLLTRAGTAAGRKELAKASGLTTKQILAWVNRADLMRVRGVGSEYSDLLEAAGVDTVKELRRRSAANLAKKMAEVNDATIKKTKKSIVRRVPAQSMVERWVAHANELDPVVTH